MCVTHAYAQAEERLKSGGRGCCRRKVTPNENIERMNKFNVREGSEREAGFEI
jgi:hypothetical protein